MDEMQPQDHTAGWMEFLKKPENLMTGLVMLAGLTQQGRPGQSQAGQVGERALGALAFRGQLDAGMQDRSRQATLDQDQRVARGRQLDQGDQQIGVQRDQIAAQEREGAANRANQIILANTARPETPGNGKSKSPFDDPYEEEMFKQFVTTKMTTDPSYVVDPMEWLVHIQPYRNANAMLKAAKSQGILGEIVMKPATKENPQGQFVFKVKGVEMPIGSTDVSAPNAAAPVETVATIEPSSSIEEATAKTQIARAAEKQKGIEATKASRKATPEEMAPYVNQLKQLDTAALKGLLKNPKIKLEEARAVRQELSIRAPAGNIARGLSRE